jgi:hypothetical protein
MLNGLADGVEEGFLRQVGDEGIIDLKECAIALLARQDFRIHLRTLHVARSSTQPDGAARKLFIREPDPTAKLPEEAEELALRGPDCADFPADLSA